MIGDSTSSTALTAFVDFILPPVCPFCREDISDGQDALCSACKQLMPTLPRRRCPSCGGPNNGFLEQCADCMRVEGGRPWHVAVSAFPFFGNARTAVHLYKYRKRIELAPYFAAQMVDNWLAYSKGTVIDAVTWIPLHFLRFFMRGYNQSAILASIVARRLGLHSFKMLSRCRRTQQQARLPMKKRRTNMKGAFTAFKQERFQGLRVLLIDDVFTTGTTLSTATLALKTAGAAQVSVLTIARD